MKSKWVRVNNSMQKNYKYELVEPVGKNFNAGFEPELTPKDMIDIGVFGGKYETVNDREFPKSWFEKNSFSEGPKDKSKNLFLVNASQPLSVWIKKGWIYPDDPQGWFLWYCRYYMGRRIAEEDQRQIKRWRAFRRHAGQLRKYCRKGDWSCRPGQRQALLHWAYDSRKI